MMAWIWLLVMGANASVLTTEREDYKPDTMNRELQHMGWGRAIALGDGKKYQNEESRHDGYRVGSLELVAGGLYFTIFFSSSSSVATSSVRLVILPLASCRNMAGKTLRPY